MKKVLVSVVVLAVVFGVGFAVGRTYEDAKYYDLRQELVQRMYNRELVEVRVADLEKELKEAQADYAAADAAGLAMTAVARQAKEDADEFRQHAAALQQILTNIRKALEAEDKHFLGQTASPAYGQPGYIPPAVLEAREGCPAPAPWTIQEVMTGEGSVIVSADGDGDVMDDYDGRRYLRQRAGSVGTAERLPDGDYGIIDPSRSDEVFENEFR